MDNKKRERMKELIDKNKIRLKKQHLLDNELLRECLEKITDAEIIEENAETENILDLMSSHFQIEYHHVKSSYEISLNDVPLDNNGKYYIIWDNADLPILKCSGASVLEYAEDLFAVDFDTYIVSEDFSEIIHHDESGILWRCRKIRAVIGKNSTVKNIENFWHYAEAAELHQGYSVIFLKDKLIDDITELYDNEDNSDFPDTKLLKSSVFHFLQDYSVGSQLVYIETDYFGRYASQAGVLFENGRMIDSPVSETGIINKLLELIGVLKYRGKDEADSLGLGNFGRNI